MAEPAHAELLAEVHLILRRVVLTLERTDEGLLDSHSVALVELAGDRRSERRVQPLGWLG